MSFFSSTKRYSGRHQHEPFGFSSERALRDNPNKLNEGFSDP